MIPLTISMPGVGITSWDMSGDIVIQTPHGGKAYIKERDWPSFVAIVLAFDTAQMTRSDAAEG